MRSTSVLTNFEPECLRPNTTSALVLVDKPFSQAGAAFAIAETPCTALLLPSFERYE